MRDRNEDALGIAGWAMTADDPSGLSALFIVESPTDFAVADGLGGHRGGARASHVAVSSYFRAARMGADPLSAIHAADEAVHQAAGAEPSLRGMASAFVGVRIEADGSITVVNVGDCRAYRLIGGYLGQLSEDDRSSYSRSTLTQVLGGERRVAIEPHVFSTSIRPGDVLLLCSDGLTDVVAEEKIGSLIAGPPAYAAECLIASSLEAGAPDNVTVVLVSVFGEGISAAGPQVQVESI